MHWNESFMAYVHPKAELGQYIMTLFTWSVILILLKEEVLGLIQSAFSFDVAAK